MDLLSKESRSAAAGVLLTGLVAAIAFAAEPPPTGNAPPNTPEPACGPHRTIDVAKMKQRGEEEFAKIDTNADGKITEVEFLAAEPPRGHGRHHMGAGMGMGPDKGMGRDKGPGMGPHHGMAGKPEETAAQRQAFEADFFKAVDTDGNGQLSPAEFAKAHDVMRTMMKKRVFAHLDRNSDGVLDKDEFPPFSKKLAAMDTDGNGTVTADERHSEKQAPPSTPSP